MADVLLTHSYHLPYDAKQVRKMQPYPPLATLYAAANLRAHGISVAVFDTMVRDPREFAGALERHRPRIVAVYDDDFNFLTKMCLTRMREVAFDLARQASEQGSILIAHGSDASDHAAEYLENGFTYVLAGEAEEPLRELVAALLCDGEPCSVPGVAYLSTIHSVFSIPRRRPNASLDTLPLPARDLIDFAPYRDAWIQAHGYFSTNLISSRGCPYRCNWCAKPIFGDNFHLRSAAAVAAEMELLKTVYGARHLWFADDIFGLDHRWLAEFAREVAERQAAVPFKAQCRADLISGETAKALKTAGAAEIWMGVESGSQRVLRAMDKGLEVGEIIAAREHLRREGIRACYFLQFGYPGETWDDIRKTIALVRKTRPNEIGVSLSYPLPGTRFYERVKSGIGRKRNWRDSDDLCVTFKGAYTDGFYRAIRDALHAEVESWAAPPLPGAAHRIAESWRQVEALEPQCRNADATVLDDVLAPTLPRSFVPLEMLACKAREA